MIGRRGPIATRGLGRREFVLRDLAGRGVSDGWLGLPVASRRRGDSELVERAIEAGTRPAGTLWVGDDGATEATPIDRYRRAVDADLVGNGIVTARTTRRGTAIAACVIAARRVAVLTTGGRIGSAVVPALLGRRRVSAPARESVHRVDSSRRRDPIE
jgi:hypothetical protein